LEDLHTINAYIQEENRHLKEKVKMYEQRMEKMEMNLQRSTRLLPLLNN
jgi:hypothetical protein